ncbi:MAG: adenylate/guanylate cyclase domain-containing protein [Cyanobacteriota bacterium]|nr:adenylate/guanylate cyclase domain-containing protein [Cyanobacteriota bacterium]
MHLPSSIQGQAELLGEARILVVDDSKMLRMGIARSLRQLGVNQIEEAVDGQQALQRLEQEAFDLMLLDMEMPEMNGLAVLARMQANPELKRLPVIVISGGESIDEIVACIEMGAEDFLPKPFSQVLLRARLTSSLEKKKLRDLELLQRQQLESQHLRLIQEQEKSELLLLNILPLSISERLKGGEHRCADSYPSVSVLFADLVGFTRMSQGMSAGQLVEVLHELFSEFDQLVARMGLEKIKTIGDCYMLVGGLPEARNDHAAAVVETGLDMVAAMDRFNQSRNTELKMRIGIHSGPVVAGVIGKHKFTYDIWGNTVNVASRMESSGSPGRVHISAQTADLLGPSFVLESRGLVEAKGLGEVATFFVNDQRKAPIS